MPPVHEKFTALDFYTGMKRLIISYADIFHSFTHTVVVCQNLFCPKTVQIFLYITEAAIIPRILSTNKLNSHFAYIQWNAFTVNCICHFTDSFERTCSHIFPVC